MRNWADQFDWGEPEGSNWASQFDWGDTPEPFQQSRVSPERSAQIASGANDRAARRFGWDEPPAMGRPESTQPTGRVPQEPTEPARVAPIIAGGLVDLGGAAYGIGREFAQAAIEHDYRQTGREAAESLSAINRYVGMITPYGISGQIAGTRDSEADANAAMLVGQMGLSLPRVPLELAAGMMTGADALERNRRYRTAGSLEEGRAALETPTGILRAGQAVREMTRDDGIFAPDPDYAEHFGVNAFGAVVSMLTFVGPAVTSRLGVGTIASRLGYSQPTTRALQSGAQFGTAGTMAGLSGVDEYLERYESFLNENPHLDRDKYQALMNSHRGILPGVVQILNLNRIIGPMIPAGRSIVQRKLADLAVAGLSEFAVEGGGALIQNLEEMGYNPDRQMFDDVLQRGGYGFLAAVVLRAGAQPYVRDGVLPSKLDPNEIMRRGLAGESSEKLQKEIMGLVDAQKLSDAAGRGEFEIDFLFTAAPPVAGNVSFTVDGAPAEGLNQYADPLASARSAANNIAPGLLDAASPDFQAGFVAAQAQIDAQSEPTKALGWQSPATGRVMGTEAAEAPPEAVEPVPEIARPASPRTEPTEFLTTPDRPDVRIPRAMVPAAGLQTDAEAYQYKAGGDADGVTDRLKGVKRWDDLKSGRMVIHERMDGTRYVADGHQRLGLARRLEAEGHPPIQMDAIILREADGFSVEDARIYAASKNIAEGSGTAWDAAKVFRDERAGMIDSLPPNSAIVRDGRRLARLSDEATQAAINADVDPAYAGIAAQRFSEPTEQLAAIQALVRFKPATQGQAGALMEDLATAGARVDTMDLFGGLDDSVMQERMRIIDRVRSRVLSDKAIMAGLIRNQETIESAAQNVVDEAGSDQARQDAETIARLIQHISTNPELNQYVTEQARKVADGEIRRGEAIRSVLQRARASISAAAAESDGRGSQEVRARDESEQEAPPLTLDGQDPGQGLFDAQQQVNQGLFGTEASVPVDQGPGDLFAGPRPDQSDMFGPKEASTFEMDAPAELTPQQKAEQHAADVRQRLERDGAELQQAGFTRHSDERFSQTIKYSEDRETLFSVSKQAQGWRLTKSTRFPGTGITGTPTMQVGIYPTVAELVQAIQGELKAEAQPAEGPLSDAERARMEALEQKMIGAENISDVPAAEQREYAALKARDNAQPAEQTEAQPEQRLTGNRRIGTNTRGKALWEDENGVRSYVDGGIRVTESVQIIPGRGAVINRENRGRDYLTPEEYAEHQAELANLLGEAPQAESSLTDQLTSMSDAEIEAAFDAAVADVAAADTSKPVETRSRTVKAEGKTKPRSRSTRAERTDVENPDAVERTAGQIAKSFGHNVSSAGMNGLKGLTELFGGSGKLNSGLSFDEVTYAKAKPHFQAVLRDFQAAGKDVQDFMRMIAKSFGEGVKPYLVRFVQDLRENTDGLQSALPDGDARAGAADVQGTAESRQDGRAPAADEQTGASDAERTSGEQAEAPGRAPDQPGPDRSRADRPRDADRVPDRSVKGENYQIEPGALAEDRGRMQKARDNIRAIELVQQIEAEGRPATREEQQQLARYVGWGGLAGAFPDAQGKFEKGLEKVGERLKELLSDTEYATARRSIQYAHYTAENIVSFMWRAAERMGFQGGKVFEPGMGTGNFAGLMPADLAAKTDYNGLELDHMTARIARLLYPKWGVRQDDFTKAPLPKGMYDLEIGNPPFGDIPIKSDAAYPQGFLIHDYFFAKGMDGIRPGGIQMFITSAGTLNKLDSTAREYLADQADLVAAVRLPGNAFEKNAGTSVTTDIIILRKRLPGEPAGDRSWTETVQVTLPNKHGQMIKGNVSRYFVDNPDMVLGEEGFFDPLYENRYGVRAPKDYDLDAALNRALGGIPENILSEWQSDTSQVDFATSERKEGSFYIGRDGQLMQQREGVGTPVQLRGKGVEGGLTKAGVQRIQKLIPIRDSLRAVYQADLAGDAANAEVARKRLNEAYDEFVAEFGPINKANFQFRRPTPIQAEKARSVAREEARYTGAMWDEGSFDPTDLIDQGASLKDIASARAAAKQKALAEGKAWDEGTFDPDDMPDTVIDKRPNVEAFMADPESYRLRSIERYNDDTGESSKGDVFTQNIIRRETKPSITSVEDAVLYSLNQRGRLDMGLIAHEAGMTQPEVIERLGDKIYQAPGGQWVTRDEYLSGNVRRKLRQAKAAALRDRAFERNVEALEAVQPAPLPPSEIDANLGMPWIPTQVVEQFMTESLGLESAAVTYTPLVSQWTVSGDSSSVASVSTYGTPDIPATKLLQYALNRQDPQVWRNEYEGGQKVRRLDTVATQAAQDKANLMRERFSDWVWSDADRANTLADLYNEEYNSLVDREYNGDYLTTPGISDNWSWRPHQRRVIARIIQSGNTYMAHGVGAGKTSAMIGAGMEMRRLGLVRKPMYAVPNHMLQQFTKEFYEQYPTAKIMVADEQRFHTSRRKQFIADAASQDLDAIIITHSAFGLIPISEQFQDNLIQQQLDQYREVMIELEQGDGDTRITRKRMENQIERLEQRLSGRGTKKTDQVFTFEEMGVDFLFMDEAHEFRKLDFATKMGNLKGVSSEGSQASWDLFVKTRYLETINPGRSLVLASGTPVTNTMAELYTVSRYLQPAALKEKGLEHFDAWASAFGDTVTILEQDPAGGYKTAKRFARFVNVPELSAMVRQNMDVVTSNQLAQYVTRPTLKGGKRQFNLAEKTDDLESYQDTLAARMTAISNRKGPPKKGDDILLNVINDGRHAAIDMRLVDPELPNNPGSKLNLLVDNVFRIWQETKRQKFHKPESGGYSAKPADTGPAAQMIFANLGLSGTRGFSVPSYIRAELISRGVPAKEIAYIKDFKSHVAKQRLFNDVNEGRVRVLIGSTKAMGTGVNAQRRLYAVHNLDPLWFPADDEQRNGRILRQGNMNPEIEIHDYSTKGTYDATMWSMMETKARFIQAFFEGDPTMRNMDDLGEASQYEQAKAMTTADPRLIELTELKQDLERAQRKKQAHEREQYANRVALSTAKDHIRHYSARIPAIEADIARRTDTKGDAFKAVIDGQTVTERVDAGDAILGRLEIMQGETREYRGTKVAEIGGFDVMAKVWGAGENRQAALYLQRDAGHETDIKISTSSIGLIRSIENALQSFEGELVNARNRLEQAQKTVQQLEALGEQPFTGQAEIDGLIQKVREIEKELTPVDENEGGDEAFMRSESRPRTLSRPRQRRLERLSAQLNADLYAVETPDAMAPVARQISDLFNVETIFIDGADGWDGVNVSANEVFISVDAVNPMLQVTGHELTHAMRRQQPQLYNQLVRRLTPLVRDMAGREATVRRRSRPGDLAPEGRLQEEVTADLMGEMLLQNPRLLSQLRPGLAQRALQFIRNFFTKLLRGKSNETYSDLFAARDAVREVLRNWSDVAARDQAIATLPTIGESAMMRQDTDAQHRAAVESGDMETAQRLVDEAARAAGFNMKLQHHTPDADWTSYQFRPLEEGGSGNAIWLAPVGSEARSSSSDETTARIVHAAVNNPLIIDSKAKFDAANAEYDGMPWSISEADAARISQDHDSVIVDFSKIDGFEGDPTEILVFSPNQIKSADPATYDDAGNLIPLSERFNLESDDIRFSRSPDANAEIKAAVAATPAARKAQEAGKPIKRSAVINPLSEALGMPVYTSRTRGKQATYIPHAQALRVKRMDDMQAVAWGMGYFLRETAPELTQNLWTGGRNRQIRNELKSMSANLDATEGFANFMMLYMLESESAQNLAPLFFEKFTEALKSHPKGKAIQDGARDFHAWHAQDVLSQAKSKIGIRRHLKWLPDKFSDRFRQGVFDDFHGIRMAEDVLAGGKDVPGGFYETARLTRAAGAIIEGAVHSWGGVPYVKKDGSFGYKGKALEEILAPVTERLDDWIAYAVGRSAGELMSQGRENLFTRAEIRAMRSLGNPEFRKAFDEYQEWNKGILDFAESLNLINPESRAQWRRTQYIPFYRMDQNERVRVPKKTNDGNFKGIKALTGGTGELNDILGNMINNARLLIEQAIQNDARLKIVDAITKAEGGGQFLVKVPKGSLPASVSKNVVEKAIRDALGAEDGAAVDPAIMEFMESLVEEMPDFISYWMHGREPKGQNIIVALREGKPEFYEVHDPLLLRSMLAFNRPAKHPLISFFSAIRRIGQTTVTLTPDFMAANLARDTVLASILSKHGFRPGLDSVRGMKSRLAKDKDYQDFMANGGGLSSLHSDYLAYRKHLERFYARKGINYRNVIDTPGKMLYMLERLGESVEMGTRIGEYRKAIARGAHPRHAAYMAREIGSDYAMRGDNSVINGLYDTVMFLKAGMNGLDRIARGSTRDTNRAAIGARVGMLALASAMLALRNREIPEYDELEDWDKDAHWHFIFEGQDGQVYHFRYPKIWQVGGIASIAERMVDATMDQLGNGDADAQKLALDILRITRDTNFIGIVPQFASPWIEQYANRNAFTGAPIETQSVASLEPWARSTPYTSEFLTQLGELTRDNPRPLQFNPVRAEALLRGYFNTWASYGLDLADEIVGHNKPARRIDQTPVARRFYKDQPPRRTRFETEFYDLLRESREVTTTLKKYTEQGRFDLADRVAERSDDMLWINRRLNRTQQQLQRIHRDMRDIQTDPIMSPKEKRRQLDELQLIKNEILRDAVEMTNEVRRESRERRDRR